LRLLRFFAANRQFHSTRPVGSVADSWSSECDLRTGLLFLAAKKRKRT